MTKVNRVEPVSVKYADMWCRLWRRPRAEKWLALQSVVLCLLSVVALHIIGYGRWKRILKASFFGERKLSTSGSISDDIRMAEAAYAVVNMVARNVPWGVVTCLPRSLTLWWLLRRYGIESELRIGVRRYGEGIIAHAWVDCHGTSIGETEIEKFVALDVLPVE